MCEDGTRKHNSLNSKKENLLDSYIINYDVLMCELWRQNLFSLTLIHFKSILTLCRVSKTNKNLSWYLWNLHSSNQAKQPLGWTLRVDFNYDIGYYFSLYFMWMFWFVKSISVLRNLLKFPWTISILFTRTSCYLSVQWVEV